MKKNLIKKIADKLYELEERVIMENTYIEDTELELLAKEIIKIAKK